MRVRCGLVVSLLVVPVFASESSHEQSSDAARSAALIQITHMRSDDSGSQGALAGAKSMRENPSGYEFLGMGPCIAGHINGWVDGKSVASLAACSASCSSEPQCEFFTVKEEKNCLQFSSEAKPCEERNVWNAWNTYRKLPRVATWTSEEIRIVRAKLTRMMVEPDVAVEEAAIVMDKAKRYMPEPAKLLRLAFHDCMKYTDGTGGCDGCLDWWGVGRRYDKKRMVNGIEVEDDGHNNGLHVVAETLEQLYTRTDFPSKTPALTASLSSSGKSRADLWALAALVAVDLSMELNNKVCKAPLATVEGQYHPRLGQPDCEVSMPRKFVFKTGRRDCSGHPFEGPIFYGNSSRPYMTSKEENHPDPHGSGSSSMDYFKRDFGFNSREVVAIMGAHTIGTFHAEISMFRYNWQFSSKIFNNGYYRLLTLKPDWAPSGVKLNGKVVGYVNASGQAPIGKWQVESWKADANSGPFQMLKKKYACPICEAPPDHSWWNQWKNPRWQEPIAYDECCANLAVGDFCKPECMRWMDDAGIHETIIPSDYGLWKTFTQTADGRPNGCPGWYTQFNGEAKCPNSNDIAEPPDSTPMYQVVEEYAQDGNRFLADFFPTFEKLLSNGYEASDLTEAPVEGMAATCSAWDQLDIGQGARNYECA